MNLSDLTAISPIDGRYNKKVNNIRPIFSEFAFLKFRIKIEISWLKKLSQCNLIEELPPFNSYEEKILNRIVKDFNEKDARRIKEIEKYTNHDIKAVELFLREKISSIPRAKEFIHFACTSEDINNMAYALMLMNVRKKILIPIWNKIIKKIEKLSNCFCEVSILSRTHGQPATPSTLGKEMINFAYRLSRQLYQFKNIEILGKMNGTVGNYNVHIFSYPKVNWIELSKEFVTNFGIKWNPYSTQIEPHDYISEFLDCIKRFNTILIDFNRDIWGYMSLNYLHQSSVSNETGSSVMPHKVNPIDFENSEGNLSVSNTIMQLLSNQLPISRWQRDLTDSTTLRNLGVCICHALIAYHATIEGMNKLKLNKTSLSKDLKQNWQILSEPIQIIMRKHGISDAFEKLKNFSRGKKITKKNIQNFISSLSLPKEEIIRLKKLSPHNYIGLAKSLVKYFRQAIVDNIK